MAGFCRAAVFVLFWRLGGGLVHLRRSDLPMDTLFEIEDQEFLLGRVGAHRWRRRAVEPSAAATGVRFAFYGRTSTAEFQDPATSRAWQREIASALVVGRGTITQEFFDVGCSRRVAWERRPQAAALLERAGASDRAFDAVVVGEFERAFADRQFRQVARRLAEQGIEVWLPEAGGPVRLEDPTHLVLMQTRARIRIGRTRRGGVGANDWIQTRRRRGMCGGCSPSAWPGAVWRASRGS